MVAMNPSSTEEETQCTSMLDCGIVPPFPIVEWATPLAVLRLKHTQQSFYVTAALLRLHMHTFYVYTVSLKSDYPQPQVFIFSFICVAHFICFVRIQLRTLQWQTLISKCNLHFEVSMEPTDQVTHQFWSELRQPNAVEAMSGPDRTAVLFWGCMKGNITIKPTMTLTLWEQIIIIA